MNKDKGITLIEILIALAIFMILISMLGPLVKSIAQSNKKNQEITQLDLNLGRAMEVFKRAVTSSKRMESTFGSTTSGIYISDSNGEALGTTTGNALVVNVPKSDGNNFIDEKVIFYIEDESLKVNSTENSTGNFSGINNPTVLVKNIIEVESQFIYDEKIAVLEITVWLDKDRTQSRTIKEAAVTRINIEF